MAYIILQDLRREVKHSWKKIIFSLIIICIVLITYRTLCIEKYTTGAKDHLPGIIDYYSYFFYGVSKLELEKMKTFQTPYVWLLAQFLISFVIADYVSADALSIGKITLIRTGDRKKWWLSKVISNALVVVIWYGLLWMMIYIFNAITASNNTMLMGDTEYDMNRFLIYGIVVPLIALVVNCQIQILIEELTNQFVAISVIIGMDILAVQFPDYFFIGNYRMLSRNGLISSYMNIFFLIMIFLMILITCLFTGLIVFEGKDVIGK